MFKITAVICVLAVHGQDLCLTGDIPLTKPVDNKQMCLNTIKNIAISVDEEFKNRGILLEMSCKQIGEQI
jgi:hypothetical protein|tara:strand:- start:59 stop:268 length:210 start_codon:yes stop_codon:yes gene_type:complete